MQNLQPALHLPPDLSAVLCPSGGLGAPVTVATRGDAGGDSPTSGRAQAGGDFGGDEITKEEEAMPFDFYAFRETLTGGCRHLASICEVVRPSDCSLTLSLPAAYGPLLKAFGGGLIRQIRLACGCEMLVLWRLV